MGVKIFRPRSPGRRAMTGYDFEEITKTKPERSLTVSLHKVAGRNNHGWTTIRYKGGGHKRRYRIVDFMRDKIN
ncbi:50S ribosomal protein L2, partial [Vibrio parahaemolyticus]